MFSLENMRGLKCCLRDLFCRFKHKIEKIMKFNFQNINTVLNIQRNYSKETTTLAVLN